MSDQIGLFRGVQDLLRAINKNMGMNTLVNKGYLISQIAIFITEAENAGYIKFDENDVPVITNKGQLLLLSSSERAEKKFIIEELADMKIETIDRDDIYLPLTADELK